ncbi:glycosyltransferase family protein [Acuticoccus sp.]|uniref:glycosyltransferase family protein n=1 Tax=Acuticoccus sp. TaxID=1904378 RepID=UPI003B52198A
MPRALIWVTHLLGTGHTVRAAALARALAGRGTAVTLVVGATPPATLDLAGLDVVALPPVRATDATFARIVGADGRPYEALVAGRAALLGEVVAGVRPDVIVTEAFPLGRRAFAAELVPLLSGLAVGRRRPVVAASVRDVLVRKPPAKEAAMAALARRWYDLVLVHGDPSLVSLPDTFGAAGAIADLTHHTGYVDAGPVAARAAPGECGDVVVSCGGGAVGARLVEAALGAARRVRERRFRIFVPAALAHRIEGWRAAAPDNALVEPNRRDFRALLVGAALSVSQAGYNTAVDVVASGVRAIFVPFAADGETEQTDRAAAFEARGLARVVEEASLDVDQLVEAVRAALAAPPPARPELDLRGAERSAELLLAAVDARTALA